MTRLKLILAGTVLAIGALSTTHHPTLTAGCPECGPVPSCDPNAPVCNLP